MNVIKYLSRAFCIHDWETIGPPEGQHYPAAAPTHPVRCRCCGKEAKRYHVDSPL